MANEKKEKKSVTKKLLHKYRLVILNEESFEERFAIKLTRLNVFVIVGISTILLIALTTLLIAFTPLREYIPGYTSTALRKKATSLVYQTDSLQRVVHQQKLYLESIRGMLTGEAATKTLDSSFHKQKKIGDNVHPDSIVVEPSKADSILRERVQRANKYSISRKYSPQLELDFFTPVSGQISSKFNVQKGHLGVDIVAEKKTPVKAIADGMVIFAEFSSETGNVLIIEHRNGLISVYKHNISLAKQQGDPVEAGEVIAKVGSTGEFSTGPHLHFEIWKSGYPLDPQEYFDFE